MNTEVIKLITDMLIMYSDYVNNESMNKGHQKHSTKI